MAALRFPHLSPFLYSIVLTTIALHISAEPTCTLDRFLNECGYFGIHQAECESRDCCWDPNVPEGEPWCFHKNGGYEYFSTRLPRVDCGYFGIFPLECEHRGCMYAPAFGQSWCFFPNTNTDPDTCPYQRVECGYYGIDQDECEGRGCCWSPLEEGSSEPWCFHSTESATTATVETSPEETTEEEQTEEPTEEASAVELPSELPEIVVPGEEGEGIAVRRPEESPAEEESTTVGEQTEQPETVVWEAVPSAVAPAVAERESLKTEHLRDETSQAMELNFDIDTFEKPISLSAHIQKNEGGFRVACDTEALTEHECLAVVECYWVPEVVPGFGACLKRLSNPGRRSMGKFFKPKTVY